MTKPARKNPANAKATTEQGFGRSRSRIRSNSPIARAAREIWPTCTAAALAAEAGAEVRTAELWLEGRDPSFAFFVALLHGRYGDVFQRHVMEGCAHPPVWWVAQRREAKIARERQAKLDAERRLRALESGEDD